MPWSQTDPMKERMKFVALASEGLYSMTELCERAGITRQAGYTLLRRYEQEGVEGLTPRSHAPKSCPHRIPEEIRTVLLEARKAHPLWGPRKILVYLGSRRPELALPAASTVGDLYKREGLVKPRPHRRKWSHPGRVSRTVEAPNQLWNADFKGQFRMGDGKMCYPLTVTDTHSRYLLACDGLSSTAHSGAQASFEHLFRARGLPQAIRSDNGNPFCTKAIAGLSQLSVWWTQLGIKHERTEPGHPEQNGSHERMHRTLKAATQLPPAADVQAQQERFDAFRCEFNQERPHQALEMKTPGSLYVACEREMPERIAAPQYAGHCQVRRVRGNGILYFGDRTIFLSELLIGQDVALEEVEDGVWSIYFYDLLLARLDQRTGELSG
jgi:transposase InsO family protein